eukprot:172226_1
MLTGKRVTGVPSVRSSFEINMEQAKMDYWNHGYIIVRKLFNDAECDLLQQTIQEDSSITNNEMAMVDHKGKSSKLTLWFKLGNDLYSMFARSASIYHTVQTLIDTEPYMFHSKLMMKEPHIGGSWEPHQDFGYWYEQGGSLPDQLLSVMVAVDDHTRQNGCLKVWKGSHKFGRLDHEIWNDQTSIDPHKMRNMIENNCELVHCELKRGDVLIFHSLLVHASDANKSDNWRRALITGYNGRYAPIYKQKEKDFVIPSYCPIDVIDDADILKCGIKPHSPQRNDFFNRESNIESFTPTQSKL